MSLLSSPLAKGAATAIVSEAKAATTSDATAAAAALARLGRLGSQSGGTNLELHDLWHWLFVDCAPYGALGLAAFGLFAVWLAVWGVPLARRHALEAKLRSAYVTARSAIAVDARSVERNARRFLRLAPSSTPPRVVDTKKKE